MFVTALKEEDVVDYIENASCSSSESSRIEELAGILRSNLGRLVTFKKDDVQVSQVWW